MIGGTTSFSKRKISIIGGKEMFKMAITSHPMASIPGQQSYVVISTKCGVSKGISS